MHIKAVRLMSGLVGGAITGAQLETLLATNDYKGAWVAGVLENKGRINNVSASSTAMTAMFGSSAAINAAVASSTAMAAIAASSTAMTALTASSAAINAVVASSTAMAAIAASSTAMTAIFGSSAARVAVHGSTTAVDAIANTANAVTWLKTNKLLSLTGPNPDGAVGTFQTISGLPAKLLTLTIRNNGGSTAYTHTLNTKTSGSRSNIVSNVTNVAVDHVNAYSSLTWDTSYASTTASYAAVIEYVDMT